MMQGIEAKKSFDHLVYLRIFEGCNLHCEHCFIPSNPKRMKLEQIRAVPSIVRSFAKKGDKILLQWHGGEPTALGKDWIADAIDVIHSNGEDYQWMHGIQTNLLNYSSEWSELYHHYFGGEVGVSWDPLIRLTKRGCPESNSVYEDVFWKNMEVLQRDGLSPYLVITATKVLFEVFKNPVELFQFMSEKNIKKMHLERITKTGYARENWSRLGLDNAEYAKWMSRFLRGYISWKRVSNEELFVSPFDGLMEAVRELGDPKVGRGGYGCWSGVCDTRFHTIDANGYKAGCTALNSEIDNSRAGKNVEFPIELLSIGEQRKSRTVDCSECEFLSICSSGCLATEKWDGSGECAGAKGLFQELQRLNAYNKEKTHEHKI